MRSITLLETENPFRPVPLELRHLRLVVAIVEEGGLTRAGERLNLTQSALSHQLKQIEDSLGVTLFTRAKRRLVLTDSGEEVLDRARSILTGVAELENDLRERATGRRGSLRLATQCYTCYEWLPALLKRFYRSHPNVDVQIVADATADPVDALRKGRIDLAIVSCPTDETNLDSFDLFKDELLLLTPPGHRLASKDYVTSHDFGDEPLILYSVPAENFFYRQYLAHSPTPPKNVTVIKLTEAIFSMVRAGLGVTVAARWAVADELRAGRMAGVSIGPDGFYREWRALVRHSQRHGVSDFIGDFVDLVAGAAVPVRFAAKQA